MSDGDVGGHAAPSRVMGDACLEVRIKFVESMKRAVGAQPCPPPPPSPPSPYLFRLGGHPMEPVIRVSPFAFRA
jgi:hypothetical protein